MAPVQLTSQTHPKSRQQRAPKKQQQNHTPTLPSCGGVWQAGRRGHQAMRGSCTSSLNPKPLEVAGRGSQRRRLVPSTGFTTIPQGRYGQREATRSQKEEVGRSEDSTKPQRHTTVCLPRGLSAMWSRQRGKQPSMLGALPGPGSWRGLQLNKAWGCTPFGHFFIT